MSKIKFIKANAAPTSGNWESDAVYFVAKTIAGQTAAEMYVTDQAGNPREVSTENLVLEIIETLKGAAGGLAGLDNNGKVQVSQQPAGNRIEFEIVTNMAALTAC
ncbi:MAG: hypothetical protein LAT81_09850, partial [Oceanicaulis sp.]|nr:hypothetical protein [Oceanicaulis sp.]